MSGTVSASKMRTLWIGLSAVVAAAVSLPLSSSLAREPANTDWDVIGNTYLAQHHSDLAQIDKKNVTQLDLAWAADLPTPDGIIGDPLVKDNVVFTSGSTGHVFANDARTGKLLWDYQPEYDFTKTGIGGLWGARINRGLSLAGNLVLTVTGDCRVIGVDQKSGQKVWEAVVCERTPTTIDSNTGAVHVGGGKIFAGHGCGDTGYSRGYMVALDEKTGKELWRFYTVPDDPAKPETDPVMIRAAKTWGTGWHDKTRGCGSVWDSMTYDKKLNLLYVGTGGPAPWSSGSRPADKGDELYTNAIVALDANTGKYVWHYTVTPNDSWNLEATNPSIIAELPINGKTTRVLLVAPKNGFFYVLDAKSGKLLSAGNPIPVNWASGIDMKTGRPITLPDARYWEKPEGALVIPGPLGARGPNPMAYDPKHRMVFAPFDTVPTWMTARGFFPKADIPALDPTDPRSKDPKFRIHSDLIAWDPISQKARWQVPMSTVLNGGVLHTSGGLVFQGTSDGWLNAYDDESGKKVWSYKVLGSVRAAPSTIMSDGSQLIIVPAGNNATSDAIRYTTPATTTPMTRAAPSRLLAFRIGGTAKLAPFEPQKLSKPTYPEPDAKLAAAGAGQFDHNYCSLCHGRDAISPGGTRPDLRLLSAEAFDQFDTIVRQGLFRARGMPDYQNIPADALAQIKAYVQSRAWADYKEQNAEHPNP